MRLGPPSDASPDAEFHVASFIQLSVSGESENGLLDSCTFRGMASFFLSPDDPGAKPLGFISFSLYLPASSWIQQADVVGLYSCER